MTCLRSITNHATIRAFTVTLLTIASCLIANTANANEEGAKPLDALNPLAPFAKFMTGEWRLKMQSGHLMFDRWHWGPGKHSVVSHAYGKDGGGNPWRSLEVFYYCPKRKQIRTLGLSPDIPGLGRSVSEGHITFDGKTAHGDSEMHQPGHPGRGVRTFKTRWVFDDDDTFRSRLQEHDGKSLFTLGEWESRRSLTLSPMPAVDGPNAKPSAHFDALASIAGRTWISDAHGVGADSLRLRTTVEWIPYVNAIYIRTEAPALPESAQHIMDAYLYHHVGDGRLKCLALMRDGGIYESDFTIESADGLVTVTVPRMLGNQKEMLNVRFELDRSGHLRERIWSIRRTDGRKLLFDAEHRAVDEKNAKPVP